MNALKRVADTVDAAGTTLFGYTIDGRLGAEGPPAAAYFFVESNGLALAFVASAKRGTRNRLTPT